MTAQLTVRIGNWPAGSFRQEVSMLFRRHSPWKAGILFYDSRDPRIIVPNRFGVGWTLNLANKWSWAIVGVLGAAVVYSRRVRSA